MATGGPLSQSAHTQPLQKIDLRVSGSGQEIVLELTVAPQPAGTGGSYFYKFPRHLFVDWMKARLRELDPTVEEEILEILQSLPSAQDVQNIAAAIEKISQRIK